MSEATQMMALRLFGLPQKQVESVLKQAAAQGCPGLRLLSREGELVVCVQAKAPTEQQARQICETWRSYFEKEFGSAVFGGENSNLNQVALEAMAKKRRLFVAADEFTGHVLETRMRKQELGNVVYDFGQQSYQLLAKKHRSQSGTVKKYPECPVQPTVADAREALAVSSADWAVAYKRPQETQPGFVMVCSAKTAYLQVLEQSKQPDLLAGNWIMDLLRRLATGEALPESVQSFAVGKKAPELPRTEPTFDFEELEKPAKAVNMAAAPNPGKADEWQKAPSVTAAKTPAKKPSAQHLYDDNAPLPEPEPKKKRGHMGRVLLCMVLVLCIAGGAALAVHLANRPAQNDLGNVGYGTADYDTAARDYLLDAQKKNDQVAAYLALPKLGGALVYQMGSGEPAQNTGLNVQAAESDSSVSFAGKVKLGDPHSNVVLTCPEGAIRQLAELDKQEMLAENSGFTIYTGNETYRYKVAAVYYWDPAETGETAFDLYSLQDLTNYKDFLTFVLGIKARSLYEMPVNLKDSDQFATLVADQPDASGRKLVITGRQQRPDEPGILFAKQITQADQPLLPLAVYQEEKQQAPAMETLNQYWMNWYVTGGATSSDVQEESGMPQEDQAVEGATEITPEMTPIPTLTPDATGKPQPSDKPTPTPSAKPGATPAATDKPNQNAQKPTEAPQEPQAPQPQKPQNTPEPPPTEEPSGPTITVTMNGVRQDMDLVECLAMVARNELGANAPMEAYKAQAVAAHSWILNQGGAPSVAGRQPSESIRQAVREVANQVVTYNGRVAFTPYFASAANGTNPSEDVWGSSRPYLVAVESPYDAQYATNWQNTRVFSAQEVADRARERLGLDLNEYNEDPEQWIGDIVKNSSGYVTSMRIGNTTITGKKFQEKVMNGFEGRSIRSAAFDISYSDGNFSVTTYGYGHGCGMSQFGAWGYAANGWTYDRILAHYYPGTSLSSVS